MLVLLSPAKKQLKVQAPYQGKATEPALYDDVLTLVKCLKKLSSKEIASLMKISDALAENTFQFMKNFNKNDKSPAILMFQGDAYQKLEAHDFSQADLNYAQKHLLMLSGLFGYLKPLDLIQNYRLDMGTPLKISGAKNLYQFWGDKITDGINQQLKKQKSKHIINLASAEYFDAVNADKLNADVIMIDFKELKNGVYKTIGTNAKRARGLMTRFILKNRIEELVAVKKFTGLDYKFNKDLSTKSNYVFVRVPAK